MRKTYVVVVCGMLAAIGALLAGPLGIKGFTLGAYSLNVSFGLVPGMLAGIMFGPMFGFLTGAVTDLAKYLITTSALGSYDPVFTLSFGIMCMLPAFFLHKSKKISYPKILLSVLLAQFVGSVVINNLWMIFALGIAPAALVGRLVAQAILIPCNAFLLYTLLKSKAFILSRKQATK
ncbi:MAG: folate family ECF transporter S component [Christensenellales bacterium]|jgi:ECF transporter S component (folate family)